MRTAGLLILTFLVIWFFSGEIQRHWDELSHVHLEISWPYILVGALLVLAAYLLVTVGWQYSILLASNKKLTFIESIGLVNISQLTKYLPGKVWSYAIQMHLLASHEISKTMVLSVNVIMLASLVTSGLVIGLGYLSIAHSYLPQGVAVLLFAGSLTFYVLLVIGGTWSINMLVRLANILFKKNLAMINVPLLGMLSVHALYLTSNILFGVAGYFVAIGIGLPHDITLLVPIIASMLLSDTIGFLSIVVPGGVGVREGVMYAMLKSAVDIQICFILPVAFRLVTTICDLLVGGLAILLLMKRE